ncbi:MarR family winged helix-turn-helix transcriptional regulator [Kitasatospora sp. NPDC048365]|uniref:MarR family winged helix-turn-helix transcriptional regulator n=1 Tax=Kitasatospora sp. NPDC048365 TaxID=3364050 RepID=UPI00371C620C
MSTRDETPDAPDLPAEDAAGASPQQPPEEHGPAAAVDPALIDPAAVVRLRLVIARLYRQLAQASTGQEFTFAQQSALARIEQHGPLRLGELAALERVAAPSMTRTVGPLVAAGLVSKVPDPHDGRSTLVELSPAGADLLATIRQERSELLAGRAAALTAHEQAVLLAALPVLEHLLVDGAPDSR